MINKPWGGLAKEDVERMVSDRVPESHTLDYKQALPDESSKSKVDFLIDVAAMANASGGDLVFGVTEDRVEGKPTSIPSGYANLKVKSLDESKRRLESLIREGIEPALLVKILHFEGLPEGPVILLRVPPSAAAPHMVTLYTKDFLRPQFYKRHNGGNHPMDISEIRTSFTSAGVRMENLKAFRSRRLEEIPVQGEQSPRISTRGPGALLIIHLLPITMFDPGATVNIALLDKWESPGFEGSRWRRRRFNFDGFLVEDCNPDTRQPYAYLQIFRSGAIESATVLGDSKYIDNFEYRTIRTIREYLALQRYLAVPVPVFAVISLLGVQGYPLILPQHAHYQGPSTNIDRGTLPLPECILEDLESPLERALRPAFDALYQSAGVPRSLNYDESGEWIGGSVD